MGKYWYMTFRDKYCLKCFDPFDGSGRFCKDHASDIIMGVGGCYYPTPEHYIEEAKLLGCSKRIPSVLPEDIKIGITRCFLLHNTTKEIFGFFYLTGIEVIVNEGFQLSNYLIKQGVEPISFSVSEQEFNRGCGMRKDGGLYMVSYKLKSEDMKKISKDPNLVDKVDVTGPLVVFKRPIRWHNLNHTIRGFIYANGDKIIERKYPEYWKW